MRRCVIFKITPIFPFLLMLAGCATIRSAIADEPVIPTTSLSTQPEAPTFAPSKGDSRNFYQVLEDLMGDFEYDLKNGNVAGLKDLAIRNIAVSENIPPSFKNHLEILVTEKILRESRTHVIQCLACRARKTKLSGDQVVISSPETNATELARIAEDSRIAHFMDIAFSYEANGIIMSLSITDPESGTAIWSHTYDSETSRAAAMRRGVDYSQLDEARKETEYTPTLQTRLSFLYMMEPNTTGTTGCLGLGLRMVERYDNRKKEVGFEVDYLADASTIVNPAAASSSNIYTAFNPNLTLLFVHAWNFIGNEENYNQIRQSLMLGIGGTYAGGFLGGLVRASYDWRLGKHFGVSLNLGYRPQASAFISSQVSGVVQGPEYGLAVNVLF